MVLYSCQTYEHLTLHSGSFFYERETHAERQRKFVEDQRELDLAIARTKQAGEKMQKELSNLRTRVTELQGQVKAKDEQIKTKDAQIKQKDAEIKAKVDQVKLASDAAPLANSKLGFLDKKA